MGDGQDISRDPRVIPDSRSKGRKRPRRHAIGVDPLSLDQPDQTVPSETKLEKLNGDCELPLAVAWPTKI